MARLTVLDGATTIGGTKLLFDAGDTRLLFDFGLSPSQPWPERATRRRFPAPRGSGTEGRRYLRRMVPPA